MQVNRTDNHWTIQNMHHHQSSVNTPVESQLTVKKKKKTRRGIETFSIRRYRPFERLFQKWFARQLELGIYKFRRPITHRMGVVCFPHTRRL